MLAAYISRRLAMMTQVEVTKRFSALLQEVKWKVNFFDNVLLVSFYIPSASVRR
jgi:hypothetical protein